eukprot:1274657-Amphidinium_carterae.1
MSEWVKHSSLCNPGYQHQRHSAQTLEIVTGVVSRAQEVQALFRRSMLVSGGQEQIACLDACEL